MHFAIGATSKETDFRQLKINCPVCKKVEVQALARDMTEKLTLFHLIPFFVSKSTFVRCSCGALLLSSQKAHVLAGLDADWASRYIWVRVSPIVKALVFGGIVAWMLPVAGLIWNGCAFAGARRYGGWMKPFSAVFLALSLLTTSALFLPTTVPSEQAPPKKLNRAPASVNGAAP